MIKKLILFFTGLAFSFTVKAQAPTWIWAQQVGGTSRDIGIITSSDMAGNVYEVGSFSGTIQLGATTLTSVPRDMYVAKYNRQGAVLWARQGHAQGNAGVPGSSDGISATTDAAGNVYVSGNFVGTLTFGPIVLATFNGLPSAFVVKFDSQGTPQWGIANNGGSNLTFATGLAVNATGDVFVSGSFFGVTTFGGFTVLSQGDSDIFLLKVNSSGNVQWVQSAGGPGRDYAGALATGPNNGVYLSGGSSATAAFGSLAVTSQGGTDAFIALYNAQGTAQWARGYGGAGDESAGPIAVAATGEMYTTGYFQGTAIFGSAVLTSQGGYDGFVLKCTSQGTPLWAISMGGSGSDSAFGAILGPNGELYVSGTFNATASFGNQTRTSAGAADIYVARYNPSGALVWVTQCGGPGNDYDAGLAYGGNGAVYVGGQFTGTAQFIPLSLTSRGQADGFVAQLQDNTPTASHSATADAQFSLYPNPVEDASVTLTFPDPVQGAVAIDLLDTVGKLVRHFDLNNEQLVGQRVTLNLHQLLPGHYLLKYINAATVITKHCIIK